MISETKLDESFPVGQFLMDGYSVPYRFDRDGTNNYMLIKRFFKDVIYLFYCQGHLKDF